MAVIRRQPTASPLQDPLQQQIQSLQTTLQPPVPPTPMTPEAPATMTPEVPPAQAAPTPGGPGVPPTPPGPEPHDPKGPKGPTPPDIPPKAPERTPPNPENTGGPIGGQYFPYIGDPEKFGASQSPKYQLLRTVAAFNPEHGVTDNVLVMLNGLGLGEFRRVSGDKVSIHNPDPAWQLPEGYVIDLINAFSGDGANPQWQLGLFETPDAGSADPGAGAGGATGGAGAGGGGLPPGGGGGYTIPPGFGQIPADPGVFTGSPSQAVGQDQLSLATNGQLLAQVLYGGQRPNSLAQTIEDTLRGQLENAGALDEDRLRLRYETAREYMDRARRSQINSARGELANRNLLSEPGIPQGAERGTLARIEEGLAPLYATEVRNILTDELGAADDRMAQALSTAVGFSDQQSRNLLATLQTATDRQQVLSDIALQTLDRNIVWNQFLADYGLRRDIALETLRSGRIQDLTGLLALFSQYANILRSGEVAEG